MCLHQDLESILLELAKAYRETYKNDLVKIILYGSYARGDYREYSDIDIVAIVRGSRRRLQDDLKYVWNVADDLELKYEMIISPTVIPLEEFEQYKDILPYYQNIEKQGIEIYI